VQRRWNQRAEMGKGGVTKGRRKPGQSRSFQAGYGAQGEKIETGGEKGDRVAGVLEGVGSGKYRGGKKKIELSRWARIQGGISKGENITSIKTDEGKRELGGKNSKEAFFRSKVGGTRAAE